MELVTRIEELIAPTVGDLGFDIVRVQLTGKTQKRLQIMVEAHDGHAITVDDCADVSRAVSAVLDATDPIPEAYTLEVSSPGIDRPLVRLADFERFAGFEARLETDRPLDGRKRFIGRLIGIADGNVRLQADGSVVDIPFDAVSRAKLVITDELLAAASQQQQH